MLAVVELQVVGPLSQPLMRSRQAFARTVVTVAVFTPVAVAIACKYLQRSNNNLPCHRAFTRERPGIVDDLVIARVEAVMVIAPSAYDQMVTRLHVYSF